MKVEITLNKAGIKNDIEKRLARTQKVLDQQVADDANYYAPEDEGDLKRSVYLSMTIGKGYLIWDVTYARKVYHGLHYRFSKDKNPNAQAKWFEVAKAKSLKKWEKIANNEYRK